jgi:predicted hotdog family 3-hydroxylacyl-ACP dehydratase
MRIDKAGIAALIPHAGEMCLLDEVTHWDDSTVSARSRTHRDAGNPLRNENGIPALSGIEYAAQAMAVHGALVGAVSGRPLAGYLVSVRKVICLSPRLDELEGDIFVEARQLAGDAERVMYAFALRVGDAEVLSGTATVMLDAKLPA